MLKAPRLPQRATIPMARATQTGALPSEIQSPPPEPFADRGRQHPFTSARATATFAICAGTSRSRAISSPSPERVETDRRARLVRERTRTPARCHVARRGAHARRGSTRAAALVLALTKGAVAKRRSAGRVTARPSRSTSTACGVACTERSLRVGARGRAYVTVDLTEGVVPSAPDSERRSHARHGGDRAAHVDFETGGRRGFLPARWTPTIDPHASRTRAELGVQLGGHRTDAFAAGRRAIAAKKATETRTASTGPVTP